MLYERRSVRRRISVWASAMLVMSLGALAGTVESPPQANAAAQAAMATGNHQIKVLDANIHGVATPPPNSTPNPSPLQTVRNAIEVRGVDVALLQEICASQLQMLRDDPNLDGWTFAFGKESPTAAQTTTRCPVTNEAVGNVVGSRFPLSGATTTVLPIDATYCAASPACKVDYNMVCANIRLDGHAANEVRACSTHLMAGWPESQPPSPGPDTRVEQTRRIKEVTDGLIAQGVSVILGGDFNDNPAMPALNDIYDLKNSGVFGGPGQFHEADQVVNGDDGPRRKGQLTSHGAFEWGDREGPPTLKNKFDYIFFSANRTPGTRNVPVSEQLRLVVVVNPYSDHEVLVGTGTLRLD